MIGLQTTPVGLELAVLPLIAEGRTDAAIARRFEVGERRIKTHISNAARRLRARNRTHLAVLALRNGLLEFNAAGDVVVNPALEDWCAPQNTTSA